MLPPGQRYERYVFELAPEIFRFLGFDIPPDSLALRRRIRGHAQNHEFDIVAEFDDGSLVVIECKDHRDLKSKEVLDFYFSVADVTYVQRERPVHGVLVSSASIPVAVSRTLFASSELYLAGVRSPITALKVLELGRGSPTIAYEYRPDASVSMSVIRSRESKTVDELLIEFEAPRLETRLEAALGIVGSGVEGLQCHAHVEAATQLLHFGLSDDAISFAIRAEKWAETDADRHLYEASVNLRAMARFQRSASVPPRRRGKRPAQSAIHDLKRRAPSFQPEHRSSALSFVGAWVGRYVTPTDAIPILAEARQVADRMDSPEGAYLMFIADVRAAELAVTVPERAETLQLAADRVLSLGPRHALLAQTIMRRAEEGQDTSIEANYAPVDGSELEP